MPRKVPVKLVCQSCGQDFDCLDYRSTRQRKYCSRRCRDDAQTQRVTIPCSQCGTEFDRKLYHVAMSGSRGQFCSFACYGIWQKSNSTGPANPNYKQGAVGRDSWNWKQQRSLTLARDNYHCVECGSDHRLHVHHLDNSNNHALDNLKTLCASCHRKAHPLPRAQDGKFQSTH